jgi:hypothetical protein
MATFVQDDGLDLLVDRFRGSGVEPVYIGWGTGAGTTVRTETTLFVEKDVDLTTGTGTRTTGTSSQQTTTTTGDTWQVTGTRTATGAGTVTNSGCFDSATIGGGRLFLKGDFTGIGLAANDSISYTIKAIFDN